MKTVLITLMIFGLFVSAERIVIPQDQVNLDNLSFKIIGDTDSYDSKTCVYTKFYSSKDSSIKIILAEKELRTIYASFEKADFMNFPNNFECFDDSIVSRNLPAHLTTIEATYNGIDKKVTNTTLCDSKKEQIKSEKFNALYSLIRRFLVNKPEVKKMRDSDLEFY